MIDLSLMIDWLGPKGAIAGLNGSDLTISEILELDAGEDSASHTRIKREDAILLVVTKKRKKMLKSPNELMEMDHISLSEYFTKVRVSKDELLDLLNLLDIRPGSIVRKNLADFAAKEISDIGMFNRVAHGRNEFREADNSRNMLELPKNAGSKKK